MTALNIDVTVNGTPVITDLLYHQGLLPAGNIGAAAKDNTLLLDDMFVLN